LTRENLAASNEDAPARVAYEVSSRHYPRVEDWRGAP